MRVGLILDRWDPARGGAERAMARLAEHLIRGGDEALVFTLSAAPGAPGDVRVVDVPSLARGDLEVEFARRATLAARHEGCDVTVGVRHLETVDVWWPHGGLHSTTLAAGERSRGVLRGVSRVLHILSHRHRVFLELEGRLLAGGAQTIWCVSEMVRDEIVAAAALAATRTQVRPNGVDLERFAPGLRSDQREAFLRELGLDAGVPTLLFLGGNWRLKGWPVLVEALARIEHLPWTLIAAGARPEAARRSIARRGWTARARAVGPQAAERLYGAADVLLQPTWRDPCSLATLEALAAGVPVVTTDANGACDLVRASGAGAVVCAGDAEAFAAAAEVMLRSASFGDARRKAREAAESRPESVWLGGLVASLRRAATS